VFSVFVRPILAIRIDEIGRPQCRLGLELFEPMALLLTISEQLEAGQNGELFFFVFLFVFFYC